MPLLDGHDPAALVDAARRLAAGELVAFPTETVYGLGANAEDAAAVAAIFAAKGRPSDHPLIVHVLDLGSALRFAPTLDAHARRLVAAFWPGPVTVIVPRAAQVAAAAAGGQGSIGLRSPSHPVARALLSEARRLGVHGIAAPSANRFGRISATTAAHVVQEFGSELAVVDGGECALGIESAIIDCSSPQRAPALLRPGTLTRAQIESVLGQPLRECDAQSPRASGTLEAHYAPLARLSLLPADALQVAVAGLASAGPGQKLGVYSRSRCAAGSDTLHRRMPDDAGTAAHELFSVLRWFDAAGVQQIWVEQPPPDPEWEGVFDRLRRAAAAG